MKRNTSEIMDVKKTRYSVLVPWIFSYVLIMLTPLVFSWIIYLQTVNIIRLDITDTNTATLKQIQQTLDGHLLEIEELSLRINSNAKVRTLMDTFSGDYSDVNSFATVKNVLDMNTELSTYALANGYIKDFSLIFNKGDFVWSAYSVFEKKAFFNRSSFAELGTYDAWLKWISEKYVNHYSSSADGAITFLQSLPIGNPEAKVNLLVTLDMDKIRELIETSGWYDNNTIFILNKDDKTLLSTPLSKNKIIPAISFSDLPGDYGLYEMKTKAEKFVVSYISSQRTQWKYVSVVPFAVFSKKAEYVKNLTLLGLSLCAIIELLIAIYFIKKNYNPLKHVMMYLKSITGVLNHRGDDEFAFIEDTISQVYYEKEVISRELLKQNDALQKNILLKLLKGRYGFEHPDTESLKAYGISFLTDYFYVVLFHIDDLAETNASTREKSYEKRQKALLNLFNEELNHIFGGEFASFMTEADDIIAAIMNFRAFPSNNWKEESSECFGKVEAKLREKYDLACTIAVSNIHETLTGINQAYLEALDAMEYQLFDWGSKVIFYDDIKEAKKSKVNYSYTSETEQKLINTILSGNFEQGRAIIGNIFNENFASGITSVQLAKCLMIDLVSTYLKALNSRRLLEETQVFEDKNYVQELYGCRTLEDIKGKLVEFLDDICIYMKKFNENNGEGRVVKKIVSLVESNYSDINLNIASLADLMMMNPKYISSAYREATGESIVTLLSKTRIRVAKELLKKETSISDIARCVGYSNSNAFIRVFKKYEGITPGLFRELK